MLQKHNTNRHKLSHIRKDGLDVGPLPRGQWKQYLKSIKIFFFLNRQGAEGREVKQGANQSQADIMTSSIINYWQYTDRMPAIFQVLCLARSAESIDQLSMNIWIDVSVESYSGNPFLRL